MRNDQRLRCRTGRRCRGCRIQQVLDTESSVHAPDDPVVIPPGPVAVELRGATFAYPGAESPVSTTK